MTEKEFNEFFALLKVRAFRPIIRSRTILNIVRAMPCLRCRKPPRSEAHHVCGSIGSLKSSDSVTVPLCRPCHMFIENNPNEARKLAAIWGYSIAVHIINELLQREFHKKRERE